MTSFTRKLFFASCMLVTAQNALARPPITVDLFSPSRQISYLQGQVSQLKAQNSNLQKQVAELQKSLAIEKNHSKGYETEAQSCLRSRKADTAEFAGCKRTCEKRLQLVEKQNICAPKDASQCNEAFGPYKLLGTTQCQYDSREQSFTFSVTNRAIRAIATEEGKTFFPTEHIDRFGETPSLLGPKKSNVKVPILITH